MHIPYVGSGPYCYSNSFAMLMGEHAPSTAVIETLTGGPFGMQLLAGRLPFFDPFGWDPSEGFDNVLTSLGWTSEVSSRGTADEALERLRAAVANGPVWVGPVEMGHLHHQPGMTGAIGADHYVVVLGVDDDTVLMHDPQGYPYATLPLADFMTAWAKESVAYGEPYTLRTGFERVGEVADLDALRAGLKTATSWLHLRDDVVVPPGTVGNGEAAEGLAALWEAGPDDGLRGHLAHFAVRVGARRLDDAATCLARLDLDDASAILREQARLVGALQYPVVMNDDATVARGLRELAPTYDRLRAVLSS
ncbi:hypothetical protein [Phytomonospora endophytica]|uniref:RADC family protein n=1 Tax=Phytomonospora endophytica TaxID=714109 RepID=A0A841FEJ0_9ACTN|nr:hypothetical protein [Phytomonospora endophytica]MBB6034254.1 hypothetical protein [Phytomonospora endophytica]GIG66646.1 hypothetical protein Pen01_29410 [Phytomonospora endophytica]